MTPEPGPRCPVKLRLASGAVIGLCDLLSGHDGDHGNLAGSWHDNADPLRDTSGE